MIIKKILNEIYISMQKNIKRNQDMRKWHIIDASGKTLGRLSTTVVFYLLGKNKILLNPIDAVLKGDFIVIVNIKNIKITGKKLKNKMYYSHSGYPGGIKKINTENFLHNKPISFMRHVVKGMLPKNKLRDKLIKKLKIYYDNNHKHDAQKLNKII